MMLRAMESGPILGFSCGGDGKQLLDLLTALDKEYCQEVSATPSKRGTKGRRKLKNLECSINFEGFNHGKARGRGSTASSINVQQSNSRHSACIYCQQTGHSSSDCPSQVSGSRSARFRGMNPQSGESSVPCSTCGTPCILRTANTENNSGRKFYSCQSQNCNFFVWEDNLNNGTGGRSVQSARMNVTAANTSRSRVRGRGGRGGAHAATATFVSATGDPVSGRRCFVCGDPSHFANVCPNRGS